MYASSLPLAKAFIGSRYFRTVRFRLIVLSLVGAMAMIGTLSIVLYLTQQRVEEQAEQDATLLAHALAAQYRTRIQTLQQILMLLAQWPAVQNSPPPQCAAAFPKLAGLWSMGAVFGLASPTGIAYCNSEQLTPWLNALDSSFFAKINNDGHFGFSTYRLDTAGVRPHLLIAYPVTNDAAQISHLVVALADTDWLNNLPTADVPDTQPAIVLADQDGQVLSSYPPSYAAMSENLMDIDLWDTLQQQGTASGIIKWPGGQEKIAALTLVQSNLSNLTIGVFFDQNPLWQQTFTALLEGLILVAGALVLVFLLILYAYHRLILRYLNSLVSTTRRMAAGDFSVRVEWADDRSEFGSLARAFNTMAANLALREQNLREQTARLERSNIELEQFAYVASHDLKEPLRMVASFCGLLQQRYADKLDFRAKQYIHYAVDGAQRMQTLISDLLKLARVTTQGAPFEQVDCQALMREILGDLHHAIRDSQAEITYSALPTVQADGTQLAQLLRNLLSNALKFRSHATPKIVVDASHDDSGWIFAVRDNGIGMEPELLDRIFLIFQRLHIREDYPGNGIGLAVCKKIVERHGGRIWVDSKPGTGSTFYFSLPQPPALTHNKPEQQFNIAAGQPATGE